MKIKLNRVFTKVTQLRGSSVIISRHEMRRKGNEIWTKNFLCKLSSGPRRGYQSCQLKHDENIETCLDEEYAEDHLHWYCASESEV